MNWTFGISEVTTWPWSFEDDRERYPRLGARAIELWEFKLADADEDRRRQLRSLRDAGLTVSSFQARTHALLPTRLAPHPADPDARERAFMRTLDVCAPELPGTVFVLNTGRAAGGDVEAAFRTTVAGYRRLARAARGHHVRLALEPLHPLQMNEDTFAWRLEDALEIVEAVGDEALGICADAWNLAGQEDLRARLARCGDRIFLAQVAGWRRPRSYLDRVGVGEGAYDLAPFLDGVRDAGYRGPIVLEIFSKDVPDSLYDRDLDAVVARSRDALAQLLGAPPA